MRQYIKTLVLAFNAIFRRDTSSKVVFYHDVGTKYTHMGTPEKQFWMHMKYLKEISENSGRKHLVAFDDGFRGIWDFRDVFRSFNIRPVVFVVVSFVGKPGYLTWDEIRTLQNDYNFDFQCHTWSHQTLTGPCNSDLPIPSDLDFRTDDWYAHELRDSKDELERQLNLPDATVRGLLCHRHEVTSLCFPVGYFSDDVIRRCIVAGYTKLYASFPGNRNDHNVVNGHLVPRCLCQFLSLPSFKFVLAGGMNPMRRRYLKMHYIL